MGGMSYKTNMTIDETTVDTTPANHEITTRDAGSEVVDIKDKISGFPFAFSVVPCFKLGDRVLLEPEAGVAFYSVTLKGDKGTYNQDVTTTMTDRDLNTNTTTTTSYRISDAASGKSPDVKYSGIGSFWGFNTQVLVHKNVAIRGQFRKGSATLTEKWDDVLNRDYFQGGMWHHDRDKTAYENSLHVATEAYALGLVYNF
jgi:hypothetical protein